MEMEMDWWSIINLVHRTFELRMHYSTEDWASFKNRTICACRRDDDGDWLERLLWWRLYVVRRLLPQSPCWRDSLCLFFFFRFVCLCLCVCFSPGPTQFYICPLPQFVNAVDVCLLNKHVRLTVNCVEVCMGCSKATDPAEWSLASLRARSSLIVWLAQCADELSCWFLKTNHSKRV